VKGRIAAVRRALGTEGGGPEPPWTAPGPTLCVDRLLGLKAIPSASIRARVRIVWIDAWWELCVRVCGLHAAEAMIQRELRHRMQGDSRRDKG
jgi:hypothetical protein